MFFQCSNCGVVYRRHAPVTDANHVNCTACRSTYHFRKGPLFVINGCPGVGKSVIGSRLVGRVPDTVVLEGDLFTQPELDTDSQRWIAFIRSWLTAAALINQSGQSLVLSGYYGLHDIEKCPEQAWLTNIHHLMVVSDDETFLRRMRQRDTYADAPDGQVESLVRLNGHLRTAMPGQPNVTMLDTSLLTVSEAG